MGWYWRRSTKLFPGVRINWSKNGPSVSVGPRGAKVNIGKKGTYLSGGIPGTGMYYRQRIGGKNRQTSQNEPVNDSNGNYSKPAISKKGCLISLFVVISLSLLLTSNYLTFLIFAVVCGLIWLVVYLKQRNQEVQPTQYSQPSQSTSVTTQPNETTQKACDEFDIHNAVDEVEHLIKEIDNSSDKVKLPSYYRKLMSIIIKLEKYDNVTISGLPLDEAKRRVLDNYRKKMQ